MSEQNHPEQPLEGPQSEPQPLLFDLAGCTAEIERIEAAGEWTGARLFLRKPEIYQAVVRMLGEEFPVQMVARVLGVSDNTVRAVRDRESAAIADFRAKIGVRRRKLIARMMDEMEKKVGDADFKDLVIGLGILDDKERLDSGAPTQRIEVTHAPATDVYAEFVKQFIDVQAEVVSPQTGLGGDEKLQRGDGGAAGSAGSGALAIEDRSAEGPVSDQESNIPQSADTEATARATEPPPDPAA